MATSKKIKKVVMITSIQPYTNYSSMLLSSYEKISASNHDLPSLVVYVRDIPANATAKSKFKNIDVKPIWKKGLGFFFPVLSELRKDRPDLIHIQYELNMYGGVITNLLFPLFLIYLKTTGAKLIITQHAVVSKKLINKNFVKLFRGENSKVPPFLVKIYFSVFNFFANKLSDFIIVHTKLLKSWLVQDYGYDSNKLGVIDMGVPALYRPDIKTPGEKYFLHFGYIALRKGLNHVITGFAKFVSDPKYCDYKLYLSGGIIDGQDFALSRIKELVNKLGIEKNVKYLKFFDDEKDFDLYFGQAFCLVYPAEITISASGPLSLAFGYHKCVLASDIGNNKYEVKHMVDGFRTANNKWDKAFKYIADHLEVVKNLEKGAAVKAEKRSWDRIAEIHASLYKRFLIK